MSSAPNSGKRGRFSSQRKTATVLRLLRSEDLELVSRELGVTAATLSGWRDDFLAGGQAALKSRPADDRDDEIARLRAKVGDLFMSLIYTCWLNEANPFDYLTQVQRHADRLAVSPQLWMPWHYRAELD
jgi:transposase-like protein